MLNKKLLKFLNICNRLLSSLFQIGSYHLLAGAQNKLRSYGVTDGEKTNIFIFKNEYKNQYLFFQHEYVLLFGDSLKFSYFNYCNRSQQQTFKRDFSKIVHQHTIHEIMDRMLFSQRNEQELSISNNLVRNFKNNFIYDKQKRIHTKFMTRSHGEGLRGYSYPQVLCKLQVFLYNYEIKREKLTKAKMNCVSQCKQLKIYFE